MKRTPKAAPQILTTDEVATSLRISKRQAQQLCKEDAFPHAFRTSAGKRAGWRVPLTDLDDFKKRRDQPANG